MEERLTLLYEAIKDNQNTIGRLDTKARFYLAIYSAIIGGHVAFWMRVKEVFNIFYLITTIISFVVVIFTLFLLFRIFNDVIVSKSNPKDYIKDLPKDLSETLFFPLTEGGYTRFSEYLAKLNSINASDEIEKILLAELLKVSVIRDLKIKALKSIDNQNKWLAGIIFFELIMFFAGFLCEVFPPSSINP